MDLAVHSMAKYERSVRWAMGPTFDLLDKRAFLCQRIYMNQLRLAGWIRSSNKDL